MPAPASTPEVLRFGVFELDLRRAELRKQGVRIKLQEQPLKVLQLLLENPAEIVSREQLRAHIWYANTFVEFDHGLYSAMARLREALGDSSESPRYIETVARRGYRFIAPVIKESTAVQVPSAQSPTRKRSFLRKVAVDGLGGLASGGLLLAILLGFNIANSREWLRRRSNSPVHSLAVLPLENLSGDRQEDYFADSMTDELITDLAQLGAVRVTSRTSVMQYKGIHKSSKQIGAELGVDAVLEGSIVRAGQRVRITAQLINAANDQHLWAQSYERDLGDVLILQDEMARSIAEEIRAKIAPTTSQLARIRRVDPNEQELYLRARYHLDRGDEAEIHKGIEYFQQALKGDPSDARSYAGIADAYLALTDYYESPTDTLVLAKQAAVKGVQLDDSLAETHEALGTVRFLYDWDWLEADRELSRAIQLNPSSTDAHTWRGVFLSQMGRNEEAIQELQQAARLDPLSLAVHMNAGWVYYVARRDALALEEWRKMLDLDANFAVTHSSIWIAYLQQADVGRVLTQSNQPEDDTLRLAALTGSNAASGNRAEAEHLLARLTLISKHHYVCPYEMATAHAVLGDKDEAMSWLEKGFRERSGCMVDLKTDPRLDSLRADPRFNELLRKVGF